MKNISLANICIMSFFVAAPLCAANPRDSGDEEQASVVVSSAGAAPRRPARAGIGNEAKDRAAAAEKARELKPVAPPENGKVNSKASNRAFKKAKAAYLDGSFDEAEELVNESLGHDPENLQARNFANTLALLKQRLTETKNDLAEQAYYRGEEFYKSGNMIDALASFQHSLKLNPESQKALAFYTRLFDETVRSIPELNSSDRKRYIQGIHQFLDGNYDKASKTFRSLQQFYPELSYLLGTTEAHCIEPRNRESAEAYLAEALKDIRRERFATAKEKILLALESDHNNVQARLMLEQVKLELGM